MKIPSVQPSHEGKYQLNNIRGISEPAELKLVVDGKMEPWGEFGPCSQSCTPSGRSSGKARQPIKNILLLSFEGVKKRSRLCKAPVNGGLPCTGDVEDTQNCNLHQCPGKTDMIDFKYT